MHPVDDMLIVALMALFALGAVGCLLVIPVVGFKFVGVLFERDPEDEPQVIGGVPQELD